MPGHELWATSRQTALRMVAYDSTPDDAPAVVVLHGLTSGIDVLRDAVPGLDPFARLAQEGVHVLALDWPGHGRSGGRRGHLTYRLAMEAVATAVDQAEERWGTRVGVFGTALGGILGFYAALEEPRVGAVVSHGVLDLRDVRPVLRRARQGVLLPVAARLWRALGAERAARIALPSAGVAAWTDLAEDPRLVTALRRHRQTVSTYDLAGLASLLLTPEDKPDVAAQTTPTLLAVGQRDPVLPETAVRAFQARLTCPTQLWVLPGAGHQLLLEHPEALLPVVSAFLRERLTTSPGGRGGDTRSPGGRGGAPRSPGGRGGAPRSPDAVG